MRNHSRTLRPFIDPELVREAQLRIEAANTIMAAALLGTEGWDLVESAEHALVLGDQALRFLSVAAA